MVDVLYSFLPGKKRVLIPKAILLVSLGFIFYLGVLLNLYLLNLSSSTGSIVKIISIIIILIIVLLGIFLNFNKSKQAYLFFPDQIVFDKENIYLLQITEIIKKQSILDKLFKTYQLILNKKFKIGNIPLTIDLQTYVQQLINYAKSQHR